MTDYGKHANGVIEVDSRSLATFERSERGEVWRGGAPVYGKHAESVIEVDNMSLAIFERSERGRCGGGGVRLVRDAAGFTGFGLQKGVIFQAFFWYRFWV